MLVSIIVPVYNVAPYVDEALDSVINQTYKSLEIIVIDDGSTDGSGEICDEYAKKDERIRVVHQDNAGLSAARNAGLNIATGDVIAFLDSDDAYCADYVSVMLKTMLDTGAEIVECKFVRICSEGKLRNSRVDKRFCSPNAQPGEYNKRNALIALVENMVESYAWNKLYRKELWDNIRFPDGHVYEDMETTYGIVSLCNKLYEVDNVLYLYRRRMGSITEIRTIENIKDHIRANEMVISFIVADTPQIFSEEHLTRKKNSNLKTLINYYARVNRERQTNYKSVARKLKQLIIERANDVGIEKCRFETRLMYNLLLKNPVLFKLIYNTILPIRQLYKNVFHRGGK